MTRRRFQLEQGRSAAASGPALVEISAGEVRVEGQPFRLPGFRILRHPVTELDFSAFVRDGGYERGEWWTEDGPLSFEERREAFMGPRGTPGPLSIVEAPSLRPVSGVSWLEARAYARYRKMALPTRRQWLRAARGDAEHIYPWGDEFDPARVDAGPEQPAEVGVHPSGRSRFGVEDLCGGVAEWCDDREGEAGEALVLGDHFRGIPDTWKLEVATPWPFESRRLGFGFRLVTELPVRPMPTRITGR